MVRCNLSKRNITFDTIFADIGAAGGKTAAGLWIDGAGYLALNDFLQGIFRPDAWLRDRAEQRFGVGVYGVFEQLFGGRAFHTLS